MRDEEERPSSPVANQLREQPRRAGLEVQPVQVAALASHPQAFVVQVHVGDVGAEDLLGPGGGLVQQAPQALLPDRDVAAPETPLQEGGGDGLGAVGGFAAPFEPGRRVLPGPATASGVR